MGPSKEKDQSDEYPKAKKLHAGGLID